MRTCLALGALLGVLLLAAPGRAQTINFGGVDSTKIVNKPINIPASKLPIAQPQLQKTPGFSLAKYIPKITLPSPKTVRGISQFPTPEDMPGTNYLHSFRWQYAQPVK